MSKFNRLRALNENSSAPEMTQAVEIKGKFSGRDINERIPPHVWAILQASGEKAASRLFDLLHSAKFDKLAPRDQAAMINLALTRAYGQADAPVKREVKVKLSNASADAVSAALERLAGSVTLPEHTHNVRSDSEYEADDPSGESDDPT